MFFRKKNLGNTNKLIGTWQVAPNDDKAKEIYGDIKMIFKADGNLIYEINTGEKSQYAFLIYSVENNFLITDQKSHPEKVKTEFYFEDDKLILIYDGIKSSFIKINDNY